MLEYFCDHLESVGLNCTALCTLEHTLCCHGDYTYCCLCLENEEVSVAREFYESSGGDVTGTLARMPKSRYVERCLLLGLQKHKDLGNYLGAFNFVRH